jgi:hypothetical protein
MTESVYPCLKSVLLAVAICLLFFGAPNSTATQEAPQASSGSTDARVVPVSGGDAIIEAFWDRHLGAWTKWKMTTENPKAEANRQWSMMTVKWKATSAGEGPTMERTYAGAGVVLTPYSQLVLSAGLPKGSKVILNAETDAGPVTKEFVCEVGHTDQFVLPLPGAKLLNKVVITFGAAAPGSVSVNLLWLGLRDPQVAEIEAARWKSFSEQPMDLFIRETPEPASAAPLYNLLSSKEGFEEAKKDAAATGSKPLQLEPRITLEPHLTGASNQNLFGRRTMSGDRLRQTFGFTKEDGTKGGIGLIDAAQKAALAGDQQALREVAKAAVQIALIPHWDADFITEFPDSSWEQRCFAQAQVCEALAFSFDLAGSFMTPAARELILRRLAEDGLGNINYNVWKNPYIFTCNQLPVFSVGRLAVYSLLEKQSGWGHLKPYTDLAFAELNESLAHNFLPDGGFPEGTGYLAYTLDNALPALAIYANARNKPFAELLPTLLSKTDDYIAALRSTERPTQLILVSDAQGGPYAQVSSSVLSVMSKIRPGGASARMLASMTPAERQGLKLWALPAPDLSGVDPCHYEPFVFLPDSGIASSCRKVGENLMKLIVLGGPAKAGHNHEDRGSFVLEFAGETFAADPGGMNYSDALATTMKQAQNHNMLVPVLESKTRSGALNPAPVAVIPKAMGDAAAFNASIDPGVLWPGYYKSWKRTFTSPSPGDLTITDDYELAKAGGVDFLWHTPLPVFQKDGQVVIRGLRGRAVITPPQGTTVEITPSRRLGTRELSTIRFHNNSAAGKLETKILLESS